jgi:hypothetical protein
MQFTNVLLALATASAVAAQGVTSIITPTGAAPAGCTPAVSGQFEITVVKPSVAKRDVEKRDACGGTGILVLTLENGILTDALGRTGYIASNYQFQFDKPPQAGAIYTAGFSVCGNSSLALGPTTVFYQCQSGDFYNLYNEDWAPQCEPVAIDIIPCGGTATSVSTPPIVSPVATTSASPAGQVTDGQPTAVSATSVISQITDGQPQAVSATPVAQGTDGQPNAPSVMPTVSEIPATTVAASVVSQITDGQPQAGSATSAAPIAVATGAAGSFQVGAGFIAGAAGLVGAALL